MKSRTEYILDHSSKWDLAEYFTAKEIASLILGLDIAEINDSAKLTPAINRIIDAYESALSGILFDLDIDGETRTPSDNDKQIYSRRLMMATNLKVLPGEWNRNLFGWILDDDQASVYKQTFNRSEVVRWLKASNINSHYSFDLTKKNEKSITLIEKTFTSKERNSMLKVILGMALEGYKYDPKASSSNVPNEICNDLRLNKLDVSDDTIRKYLNEAKKNFLES